MIAELDFRRAAARKGPVPVTIVLLVLTLVTGFLLDTARTGPALRADRVAQQA